MADVFAYRTAPGRWSGYVACVLGVAFAAVSFYWGSGGHGLLDTIGGTIEREARAGDTSIYVAVWVTGLLKLVGAALALALVSRRRGRRPVVHLLGWLAAVGLTVYGVFLEAGNLLVATKVITPSKPVEWKPLWWHLYVWDLAFLVWGILFALALRYFRRTRQ